MPIEKTVLLYTYEELSDSAKETARDWYKQVEGELFSQYVEYDDFLAICERMGVTVGTERDGKTPSIFWSGFWWQGDGASFTGCFSAEDFKAAEDIRAYAPTDEKLHAIHDELVALVERYPELSADIVRPYGDHYSHDCTMYLDYVQNGEDADAGPVMIPEADETALRDLMRRLAIWLYRYLEAEYEYCLSDEAAEEGILANEYTFLENGKRED